MVDAASKFPGGDRQGADVLDSPDRSDYTEEEGVADDKLVGLVSTHYGCRISADLEQYDQGSHHGSEHLLQLGRKKVIKPSIMAGEPLVLHSDRVETAVAD